MSKKFLVATGFLVVVAVALIYLGFRHSSIPAGGQSPSSTATPTASSSGATGNTTVTVPASPASENLATKAAEVLPPGTVATNIPPLIILQNARQAINQYAQVYGGNPVGTNPEITAAIMGNNPKHINFIAPDAGLRVNNQGEMLDAWGTPLFFHQLSAHDMEIHSAGVDRQMWTLDDLIVH